MTLSRARYGSLPWISLTARTLQNLCEGRIPEGASFVFNEVLLDVPVDLQPGCTERVGWYIRVRDGRLDVGPGILEYADFRITMDYSTVQPYVSVVFEENPELEQQARAVMIEAYRKGKYLMEGDREAMARMPWSGRLHDAVAPYTC